jgi:hypothetical protein
MPLITRIFFITLAACLYMSPANAQKPVDKKFTPVKQPYKAPKLFTTLGSYKDSSNVSVAEAERIISLPLKVVDAKNNVYTVTSYQFLYKKRVVTEDEKTGKVSPATSISSDRFTTSPLPPLWVKTVKERINSGEEIIFFDIIVKDSQERIMYAPNLKLLVK